MILTEEQAMIRAAAREFSRAQLAPFAAIEDYSVERIFRAVRGARIDEGGNDIQRLVISRALAS